METTALIDQISEISALMAERLNVRGKSLDSQVRKAGRLLPRKVRADATYLAHAEFLAGNPKLMRMIDLAKAEQSHLAVAAWLKSVDPAARRWTRALNILAAIMFNILVLGGLIIWWLWYQGMV